MSGKLTGMRVVNTRARSQAAEFDALLHAHGAIPLSYPCIEICPVENPRTLDEAIDGLLAGSYDWWVIGSTNVITVVANRLSERGRQLPPTPSFRTAVVGPGTAAALRRELDLHADVIPSTFRRDALGSAAPIASGDRVLIVQSEIAPSTLGDALSERGAIVTTVVGYRTITGRGGVSFFRLLIAGSVDAVTFASSSAVEGCATRLANEGGRMEHVNLVPIVCIGPGTARTAREHGLIAPVVPAEHTLAGMVSALETARSTSKEGMTA